MKKSYTVPKPEWWKHLRGEKRTFWKRQRAADLKDAKAQIIEEEYEGSIESKLKSKKKKKSFTLEYRYKDGLWKKHYTKYKSERDRDNAFKGLNSKSDGFEYRIPD